MDVTQRDLAVSFYDDYGDLSIYAKQYDTQRSIEFQLVEDVIPDDLTNFHVFIRCKYPNGIITMYEIEDDGERHIITSDSIVFNIPKWLISIPGISKCDLVLAYGTGEFHVDPTTGEIVSDNEIQILSTHNFNIYVEALPTNGGSFEKIAGQDDPVDYLTQLIIDVENLDETAQASAQAAAQSETNAKTSELNAKASENAAKAAQEAIGNLHISINESTGHLEWNYS